MQLCVYCPGEEALFQSMCGVISDVFSPSEEACGMVVLHAQCSPSVLSPVCCVFVFLKSMIIFCV